MVASCLPSPRTVSQSATFCSILVIRPGGIGDALLLIPTLNILRARFPEAAITVLAETRNAGAFELCPAVNLLLCYDTPSGLRTAIRGTYDCVIDSEQSHYLSAIMARFINAPIRVGFGSNTRSRLFTDTVGYSHDRYELFSFLDLLKPLGIDEPDIVPSLFATLSDTARISVSAMLQHSVDFPYITLFPGASVEERRWGTDRFQQLAFKLQQLGIRVVVIGGRGEQQAGEQIVNGSSGINLAGRTSLMETAAVIDSSCLLVTADSGMLHLAAGLNKPTVSLFGPGRYKKWAPHGAKHCMLNKHLSCSPCTTFGTTPSCPDNARCMKEISVDEVCNAVRIQVIQKEENN